ncbi:hypothetical protein F4679DRAFT_544449 [Xylaria curta]|nr:hypothetical protein F4679DRAFT_544449 [Xylaria curta]
MAVWICNCKRFTRDHVVGAELNEAQQLIALHCGKNSTGWVWSSKWLKSINSALSLLLPLRLLLFNRK